MKKNWKTKFQIFDSLVVNSTDNESLEKLYGVFHFSMVVKSGCIHLKKN